MDLGIYEKLKWPHLGGAVTCAADNRSHVTAVASSAWSMILHGLSAVLFGEGRVSLQTRPLAGVQIVHEESSYA